MLTPVGWPPTSGTDTTVGLDALALRALIETGTLLNSSLDRDFILGHLLRSAMGNLVTPRGAILLATEPPPDEPDETPMLAVAIYKGRGDKPTGAIPAPQLGEDDRVGELPPVAAALNLPTWVPIRVRARLLGFIALGGRPMAYTARERGFLQMLATLAGSAVQNALMVEALREANRGLDARVQELNTLFDLARELTATLDESQVVKLLTYALMGQLTAARHGVWLLDVSGTSVRALAHRGLPKAPPTPELAADIRALTDVCTPAACTADEKVLLARLGLQIAVPMRAGGVTRGLLGLGLKMSAAPYTEADGEFLTSLANLALIAFENARLFREAVEKQRLEEELKIAQKIQERLLPRTLPTVEGAEIAGFNLPSKAVGGDYYDVVPLADGTVAIAIADVTGKGVPASLLMANMQASLRTLVGIGGLGMADMTARMNELIHGNTDVDKFITLWWGLYDPRTGRLRYVNCGHNPPYLVRADGHVEELTIGGVMLGILPNSFITFEQGEVTIRPGDLVCTFTDGVTEAMDPDMTEYTEAQLLTLLEKIHTEPVDDVLKAMVADVNRHAAGAPQADDLTILLLRRTA